MRREEVCFCSCLLAGQCCWQPFLPDADINPTFLPSRLLLLAVSDPSFLCLPTSLHHAYHLAVMERMTQLELPCRWAGGAVRHSSHCRGG